MSKSIKNDRYVEEEEHNGQWVQKKTKKKKQIAKKQLRVLQMEQV